MSVKEKIFLSVLFLLAQWFSYHSGMDRAKNKYNLICLELNLAKETCDKIFKGE